MLKKIMKIGIFCSLILSSSYAINMNEFKSGQTVCLNNFQQKLNLPCSYFLSLLEDYIDDPTQAQTFLSNIKNVYKMIDNKIEDYKEDMNSPFVDNDEINYDKKQIKLLKKVKQIIKNIYSDPIKKQNFIYFYSQILNGYIPSTCQ